MAELVNAMVSKTISQKDCRFDSDYPHHSSSVNRTGESLQIKGLCEFCQEQSIL
jgi:hypothetical protein